MFNVIYSQEFSEWLMSLDDDAFDDVQAMIELLKEYGYNLARPYADTLNDSDLTNLKELRIQSNGRPLRAFFVFDPLRQAVVLCAGDKTGDKRFYKKNDTTCQSHLSKIPRPVGEINDLCQPR